MKFKLADRKNAITYAFWSTVNRIILRRKFASIQLEGAENIPQDQGFMLVSNHTARWDGLLVYNLINRPANFLVHPNELRGFQGRVMKSMGGFPASTQFDLQAHIEGQLRKGEGVVIFPEGDIHRDGVTHPFKSGAARFALNAVRSGIQVPIVPIAIKYDDESRSVRIIIGQPIPASEFFAEFQQEPAQAVRSLTNRMQREVCHMRLQLGAEREALQLFTSKPTRNWAQPA
jgi:1-acyl-sn-glycerol-3-phosphate acyltransferase